MDNLCAAEKYARLPVCVKPNHYDLSFTIPSLLKLEFMGEAIILVEVLERTNRINLHLLDLEFENIKLVNIYSGFTFVPERADISKKFGLLKLTFKRPVPVGTYKLEIRFEGLLAEEANGLFYIRYNCSKEQQPNIAVFSRFQHSSARKCFPCWDEPSFKASFKINITVPRKCMVVSNMPSERIEKLGVLSKYYFESTPPMCAHLVAIAIGEFGVLEALSRCGVPVRIIAVHGKEEQGRFALETALKAIKFYTDYFKTPYPLPKLDLVAVPNLKSDTMENWGLITFKEVNLLINPSTSTNTSERWIALMVTHQISHQWLGNLVGLEWWDQTWLQEAFAELAESLCVDYLFPDFQIWQHFVLEFFQTALILDESSDVHPVEPVFNNPAQLNDFHDGLGFNKGACLIRMLHHYVGDDYFREGLKWYFTNYMYKNASPNDFWSVLETVSGKPVKDMMSTWTKQTGFPVVKVFVTPGCECRHYKEGITVNLVQKKFVMGETKGKQENEKYFWIIPLSLITSSNPKKEMQYLMDSREMKIYIPNVNMGGWIKLNPGSIGYYRVQYSVELLGCLATPIKEQKLSTIDVIGILDDLFHMVKNGYTKTGSLLELMEVFENEKEFLIWSTICRILNKFAILLSHTHFEQEFERFRLNLLSKLSTSLGWTKKPEDERFENLMRQMVLGQTSWLDDEKMINQVKKDVADKLADDMKIFCYRTVAESSGKTKSGKLMKLYKTVDTHEQKRSILSALSDGSDEKLLRKVLTFAISDETTSEESVLIVMAITLSKTGRDLLWDFYRTHWRDILKKMKNMDDLSKILDEIKEKYATEPSVMEIETFFNNRLPCNEVNFRAVLDTLKNNGSWLSKESEDINKFFSQ